MLLGDITEGAGFIVQQARALQAIDAQARARNSLQQAWDTAAAWKARAEELAADNEILRADYNKLRETYTLLATLAASKGIIRFG